MKRLGSQPLEDILPNFDDQSQQLPPNFDVDNKHDVSEEEDDMLPHIHRPSDQDDQQLPDLGKPQEQQQEQQVDTLPDFGDIDPEPNPDLE